MASQTLSCPECGAVVKSSAPAGKMVRCPKCNNTFRAEEEDPPAAVKKPTSALKKPGGPVAKSRHREDDLEPPRRGGRDTRDSGSRDDEPRGSRARE